MLNRCPTSSYDQVCQVVKKELGGAPEEIFDEFDPVPIASASLAQVHVARTHQGQKVAVKVQHMHMTDTAAADYATVEFVVNTLHRLFPSFDYRWLVDEVHDSLPKELDFLNEAKNSIKCMDNFRKLSPHIADYVYAPKVYWNLSTTKLLTMEFVEGAEVNDLQSIQKLGINPHDIVRLLFTGRRKPQLVLLDHGLYKVLDNSIRTNYAALWKALVLADANGIKENCLKLGAGEDLYALFAGILTMRPWNRVIDPAVDHLAIQGNASDHSELQMYASLYFPQITELLHKLPRVILLMLKTNDCLRSVNNALIKRPSVESFIIIGRVSSEALIEEKLSHAKSLFSLLHVWLEEISLEVRFLIMQVALWILQFRTALAL